MDMGTIAFNVMPIAKKNLKQFKNLLNMMKDVGRVMKNELFQKMAKNLLENLPAIVTRLLLLSTL